jgi:hypothetical protein
MRQSLGEVGKIVGITNIFNKKKDFECSIGFKFLSKRKGKFNKWFVFLQNPKFLLRAAIVITRDGRQKYIATLHARTLHLFH